MSEGSVSSNEIQTAASERGVTDRVSASVPVTKFTASREMTGCFEFSLDILKKVIDRLHDNTEYSIVTIQFESSRSISSNDLSSILDESVVSSSHIKEVRLFRRGKLNIAFYIQRNSSTPVKYSIEGDRKDVLDVEEHLLNELNGSRQWFSPVHKLYQINSFPDFIFSFFILNATTAAWLYVVFEKVVPTSFLPAVIFSSTIISLVLQSLISKAYPAVVFNFGKGASTNAWRLWGLTLLFTMVIVGIVWSRWLAPKIGSWLGM